MPKKEAPKKQEKVVVKEIHHHHYHPYPYQYVQPYTYPYTRIWCSTTTSGTDFVSQTWNSVGG